MSERDTLSEILRVIGARSDIRIWRSNSGAATTHRGALVRFGVPGQADISGILAPSGRRIEIEVKSATGRQTQQQRRFQAMIERMGGVYILARSVGDVLRVLE